jgi:hypothetical protein
MSYQGLTVPIEQFLPEVVQYVPDVPEFVARDAIRNACIEFCEKTRIIQADLSPIPLVNNKAQYTVPVPPEMKFVDIVEAYVNDTLLIPRSSEELARIYRYTDWRSATGQPYYITRNIYPQVQLVPYMDNVNGQQLKLRVALAPTRDAAEVDQGLYEEFLEYIAFGARGRLYGTPRQAYYDKQAAADYTRMFRHGINEVRTRVNKGLTRTSNRVEYQRFA